MRISNWLSLTALVSASALAQPAAVQTPSTNAAAPAVPPLILTATNVPVSAKTNAPAKRKTIAKKPVAKKPAAKMPDTASMLRSEPLVPGPATVIASNVNVRGQARLNSEIVTRLTKGDTVTVLEEIALKNSKPDEPSAWAKIVLPAKAHAWVHSQFVDATNKTVIPKKLNLRTGPGENYSVIGTLQKGDAVKEVETKDNWIKIEAPGNAFAFVAAAYLKSEAAKPVEPTPTEIAATKPVAPPPTETPTAPSVETPTPPVAPPPTPAVEEPPPKRIVQREGIVRGTTSIQSPTHYALVSPDTGKTINYLYTTSRFLDLSRYKGLRIIVTGEEGLDDRWPNTPVITIQKIQVLE